MIFIDVIFFTTFIILPPCSDTFTISPEDTLRNPTPRKFLLKLAKNRTVCIFTKSIFLLYSVYMGIFFEIGMVVLYSHRIHFLVYF